MKKVVISLVFGIFSIFAFAGAVTDQEEFIKVAEKVMPAVVNINTERTIKQTYRDPFEDLFNDPFFGPYFNERQRQQPKEIKRKATSLGSGFVITDDGYIITNNHVIDKADKIDVTFADKSTYKAKVIGKDPDTDIAVLKIEAKKKLPFVEMANSDELKIGQWAIALGNPFGLNNTMTLGIVSAKGRSGMGIENYENFIQTDASINPGNSGGPLVDIYGRVIGINTAILSQSGGNVGIGFAIPINMAKKITDSLIKKGKVERGWLGVSVQPLEADMAKKFGLEKVEGALIGEVVKGSPAEKGGVKRGDIIIEIDGDSVRDYNDLRNKIAALAPDTKVKIGVWRDKKRIDLQVTVTKKKDDEIAAGEGSLLGMRLADIDEQARKKYNIDKDMQGVIVAQIDEESPAVDAGIKPGDIIAAIDNVEINSVKELAGIYSKISSGEQLILYVISKNGGRYVLMVKE